MDVLVRRNYNNSLVIPTIDIIQPTTVFAMLCNTSNNFNSNNTRNNFNNDSSSTGYDKYGGNNKSKNLQKNKTMDLFNPSTTATVIGKHCAINMIL